MAAPRTKHQKDHSASRNSKSFRALNHEMTGSRSSCVIGTPLRFVECTTPDHLPSLPTPPKYISLASIASSRNSNGRSVSCSSFSGHEDPKREFESEFSEFAQVPFLAEALSHNVTSRLA